MVLFYVRSWNPHRSMEGIPKPLSNEVKVGRYWLSEASDGLGSALFWIYHRDRAIGQGFKINSLEFRQKLRTSFQQGQLGHKECAKGALVLLILISLGLLLWSYPWALLLVLKDWDQLMQTWGENFFIPIISLVFIQRKIIFSGKTLRFGF